MPDRTGTPIEDLIALEHLSSGGTRIVAKRPAAFEPSLDDAIRAADLKASQAVDRNEKHQWAKVGQWLRDLKAGRI